MAQIKADTVAVVAAQLTAATVATIAAQGSVPGSPGAYAADAVFDIYRSMVARLVADGGENIDPQKMVMA